MKNHNSQDLLGGVLLCATGLFFALYAQRYGFGTTARMGAGFFPTVLGWILAGLGVLVALPALLRKGPSVKVQVGNFLYVMAALLVFAFSLPHLGLVVATAAAAFLASMADREITWRGRAAVSAGVSLVTVLVFKIGLGVQLPLWWWQV